MKNNAWKRVREQNKVTLYADNEPYAEYMKRMLSESVQYKPKEVIDLKDIDGMSEEEYNDKLKDAWFKKTHYETVEELTMAKYYNYEVEAEEEKDFPKEKTDWSGIVAGVIYYGAIIGLIIYAIIKVVNGG